MNLEAMLDKCHRGQWKVGDLDWTGTPRPMSRDDEMAIVQCLTDMAGIERLAGELFETQRQRCDDPVLREIFATFVKDELRHAHAAQMLADYYNVHHYKHYVQSAALQRFAPHFIAAVREAPLEVANTFILGGELMLDIALLRSLNDYVDDDMMRRAMHLINRDESRHVAIDFHMVEYYSSPEFRARRDKQTPLRQHARAARVLAKMAYHSRPFFRAVFFEPMALLDPSQKRIREAIKRLQLLRAKPNVANQPMARLLLFVQKINDTPYVGRAFGAIFTRLIIIEPELYRRLTDEAEERRAAQLTYEQLANEALELKYTD
ncbi:MAG: ferritin-like domain-containing protein [Myxococcales bacterium]|nr:ferritin-like domain-containing protein [Myxococcales bacterium]